MASPLVIWDREMLRYDLGGQHPFHPLRWELTWLLADALGVTDGIETTSPRPATDDELAAIHSRTYIRAVRAASDPGHPGDGPGYGLGTGDNPVFAAMHQAAALIAGGSITAARAIARGETERAVNIAGGLHHAMRDHAAGFCIYNDAALAIDTLLAEGVPRVAYIDVDVHHGDGVQRAFYHDPRVLTVSLHQSPLSLWPGTGFVTESGRGIAAGTAVNIPLPAGTGDADWLRAFHAVVPSIVRRFAPSVLVTQHGADSHADDPLADLRLTVDGQLASYRALRRLAIEVTGGRWLALGGGGYSLVNAVPRAWTHLLALVVDRDVDPATAIPEDWREAARAARPGQRPPLTMSDLTTAGADVVPAGAAPGEPAFTAWDGQADTAVDRVITAARNELFPLVGLDPHDPRD